MKFNHIISIGLALLLTLVSCNENQMEQGYKLYNDFYGQFEGEDAYKQWQDNYFHTAEGAAGDRQAWEKETREKIRTMPEGAEQMRYFGYGPHESYADKRLASRLGLFSSTVKDNYQPYVRPQ